MPEAEYACAFCWETLVPANGIVRALVTPRDFKGNYNGRRKLFCCKKCEERIKSKIEPDEHFEDVTLL